VSKKSNIPSRAGLPSNDNVTSIKPRKKRKGKNFDYQALPEEKREKVRSQVRTIKKLLGRRLPDTVELGLALLQVKDVLPHGSFRPWLRSEFRWSERTASSYMELARNFEGKTAKFADLDLGTAMALITKSTPTEVRDEVFAAADKGEAVSREAVRKRIANSKAALRKSEAKKADLSGAKSVSEATIGLATTGGGTPPTTGKSPSQEVAEALLSLLQALEKNGQHCKPDDIAELLVGDGSKRTTANIMDCTEFVGEVAAGIKVLIQSEPAIQAA
jgi:hypothetical protein